MNDNVPPGLMTTFMSDQEKATVIRDRLRASIGNLMDGAHHIDIVIVIRVMGHDIRKEFDWVKELLK
jgi:hypothetical protein